MNAFERKLSEQPFRKPPADLRETIFGSKTTATNVIVPVRWTWRDWLWPSPQAWGALAALWVIFAALSLGTDEGSVSARSLAHQPSRSITLLTFHHTQQLDHALNSLN